MARTRHTSDPPKATVEYAQLRKLLPKISKQETQELRLLLNAFEPDAGDDNADWLLLGIGDELRRRGLGCPRLTVKFVNSIAPNALAQTATVRATLESSLQRSGSSLSTLEWLALGRVCAESLATLLEGWTDDAKQTSKEVRAMDEEEFMARNFEEERPKRQTRRPPIRVSVQTMLRNVAKIPEALDAAFPGYLESGLVKMMTRTRKPDDDAADADVESPLPPSGKECVDEYADAEGDRDDDSAVRNRLGFEAWNERREAEQEQIRRINEKLTGGNPPRPQDQSAEYDEFDDVEGEQQ
jgi:hypothetical protein